MCRKLFIFLICLFNIRFIASATYKYETKQIQLPVDHFSFALNDTFSLRYLVNSTFWDEGPIFFYTGNEGDIEMFAQNTGYMWEIAPLYKAMVVFAEHRYYGQSMPYGNISFSDVKHRGYLTSNQALADFVDLISYLQTTLSNKTNRKYPVIAFGGSYGGMLTAWLRIKYPHIVNGAIASSAPILQFPTLTPCQIFNRIVTSNFKTALPKSTACAKNIFKSWNTIRKITSTPDGKAWLSSEWKICKTSPISDIDDLVDWLVNIYTNLAMLNYPYPTDFLTPLPGFPVKETCEHLRNASLTEKPLLVALGKALNVYTNYTGKSTCLDISKDATDSLGEMGWDYQSCTEMVMPICSDGTNDMFENNPWNFTQYSNRCFKKWAVRPNPNIALNQYGGKELSAASNIIFSNGLLDPWSSGGVIFNVSKTVLAVLIPEGAHHLDLRSSNAADPISVILARKIHQTSIYRWIREHNIRYNQI